MQKAVPKQKKLNSVQKVAKTITKRKLTTKAKKVTKSPLKQSKRNVSVAIVGAAGGIGQPLAMLIKQNTSDLFTNVRLFDVNPLVNGVGADLSHIPTSVKVESFTDINKALTGADIVVVPAGVPRKPGMTRDDLFNTNAKINFDTATAIAKNCPNAATLIISNPVNSMVPLVAEVLKAHGVYNAKKLFGVTTLDVYRATTFIQPHIHHNDDGPLAVPVVGGHAGTTIVPLFSLAGYDAKDVETTQQLIKDTMFGGDIVVQAKAGGGSATLSMASAGARFTESVAHALKHGAEAGLVPQSRSDLEYAFVENEAAQQRFGTDFFASGIYLGKGGIDAIDSTWERGTAAEQKLVDDMVGDLRQQVINGQKWAQDELAKNKDVKQ